VAIAAAAGVVAVVVVVVVGGAGLELGCRFLVGRALSVIRGGLVVLGRGMCLAGRS
jgi:hypothetical protein